MDRQEVARQFKEKPQSGNWTRRSLVSWLGKGCVLALAGRGVTACSDPTAEVSSNPTWSRCDEDGFTFEPSNCDTLSWAERTVDPQDLEAILAGWQLSVGGMVENEFTLTFDQLVATQSHNPIVDFHCVEGWSVLDVPWNGVRLRDLLAQAVVRSPATHVNFHTIGDEYNESLPIEVALERNSMLAYGVGGSSLSMRHGFPARVVIPRLFGYKSAKFVERIELSDSTLVGFWVARGYPYEGEVPPERLREGKY
jgi:hypothetical protein